MDQPFRRSSKFVLNLNYSGILTPGVRYSNGPVFRYAWSTSSEKTTWISDYFSGILVMVAIWIPGGQSLVFRGILYGYFFMLALLRRASFWPPHMHTFIPVVVVTNIWNKYTVYLKAKSHWIQAGIEPGTFSSRVTRSATGLVLPCGTRKWDFSLQKDRIIAMISIPPVFCLTKIFF